MKHATFGSCPPNPQHITSRRRSYHLPPFSLVSAVIPTYTPELGDEDHGGAPTALSREVIMGAKPLMSVKAGSHTVDGEPRQLATSGGSSGVLSGGDDHMEGGGDRSGDKDRV
jgi:hypothetical protein